MSYNQRLASDLQAVKEPVVVFNAKIASSQTHTCQIGIGKSLVRKLMVHNGTMLIWSPPAMCGGHAPWWPHLPLPEIAEWVGLQHYAASAMRRWKFTTAMQLCKHGKSEVELAGSSFGASSSGKATNEWKKDMREACTGFILHGFGRIIRAHQD